MKKRQQLGMDPGTASHKLGKDLLFAFVMKAGYKCHHCGLDLTRATFSIEHKVPWLDSDDPIKMFFDLENIGFSHRICNIGAARKPSKIHIDAAARDRASNRRYYEKNAESVLIRRYAARKLRKNSAL